MKKVLKMRAGRVLSGMTAALLLVSCSQENIEPAQNTDAPGTVRITLALPGGDDVVYPTRTIHSEEEWAINNILLFDYAEDENGEYQLTQTLRPTEITPIGNGEYSLFISEDAEQIGKKHKFVFLANNMNNLLSAGDYSESGLMTVCDNKCTMDNLDASKYTEGGISMSGTATVTKGNEDTGITIINGTVNCHVSMTRIVGRVDLYSNAPNLLITGATMRNAATMGYVMPETDTQTRPTDTSGPVNTNTILFNNNYTSSLASGNPLDYTRETFAEKQAEQSYPDNGLRKAFYMYERENMEGDCLEVEVEYILRDGSKGKLTVPFSKENKATGETMYVNAERNHLYKIVLGNGEEVDTSTDITAEIIDEPWNLIDIPAVIPGAGGDDEGEETEIRKKIDGHWAVKMRNAKGWASGMPILPEMWVAECNLGATKPTEMGGLTNLGNVNSLEMDLDNYQVGNIGWSPFSSDDWNTLVNSNKVNATDSIVTLPYDNVRAQWGGNWQLPTWRDLSHIAGFLMEGTNTYRFNDYETAWCDGDASKKVIWSDNSETQCYDVPGMFVRSKQTTGVIFLPFFTVDRYDGSNRCYYLTSRYSCDGNVQVGHLQENLSIFGVETKSVEQPAFVRPVIYINND